ncbi:hypothetical protein Aca07nite_49610 [Actinoplanes capillaceus]|uniref:Secreted protein n=1 Tax=Actinoplanes campanulatus TaxID=113559 RepID=A0ABQ3WN48_9ACTN|nr:hypothetical protein [Actinoplanes capillaceus]GID47686.1 hypothetical protein Aca07nite_49610 [Actinoplanes capillaceus]
MERPHRIGGRSALPAAWLPTPACAARAGRRSVVTGPGCPIVARLPPHPPISGYGSARQAPGLPTPVRSACHASGWSLLCRAG